MNLNAPIRVRLPDMMDHDSDNKTQSTVGASETDNIKNVNLNLSAAENNAEPDDADLLSDAGDRLKTQPTIPHQKFPFAFRGKNDFDRRGDNSTDRGQIKKVSGSQDSTQAVATSTTSNSSAPMQTEGSGDKKPRRALK